MPPSNRLDPHEPDICGSGVRSPSTLPLLTSIAGVSFYTTTLPFA